LSRHGLKLHGQSRRLGGRAVEDSQSFDTEPCQRKPDRLADTAGANHGHGAVPGGADERTDRSRESGRVGVVAGQPAFADDDGIDRPDLCSTRGQFVEQIDHGFLVGIGHVDAGEAQPPDAFEQYLQFLARGASHLDQLIMAAQIQRLGRPLVHGRRGRVRDRRTEQSGEKAAALSDGLHDLVVIGTQGPASSI
jgi:hypothetical protein